MRRRVLGLLVVSFALGLMIATGYNAGLHHRISGNEFGRTLFALASAISADVYGLHGNVYFEPVADALQTGGITADPKRLAPLGATFPDNLSNTDLMNEAIKRASNLAIQVPPLDRQKEVNNVRGFGNDDV